MAWRGVVATKLLCRPRNALRTTCGFRWSTLIGMWSALPESICWISESPQVTCMIQTWTWDGFECAPFVLFWLPVGLSRKATDIQTLGTARTQQPTSQGSLGGLFRFLILVCFIRYHNQETRGPSEFTILYWIRIRLPDYTPQLQKFTSK